MRGGPRTENHRVRQSMLVPALLTAIVVLIGWIAYTLYRASGLKEGFQVTTDTSPINYTSSIEASITDSKLKQSVNILSPKYCKTLLDSERTLGFDVSGYKVRGESENLKAHQQMLSQVKAQIERIGTCRQMVSDKTLDVNGVTKPEPLSNISVADLKVLVDKGAAPR